MLVEFGQNLMLSFWGKFNRMFDDGNESWDIFDYPY
jgi:hypothetical protein